MQTIEAAQRWARTWAAAWPIKDVEAIAELQAEDGDHWASMFRPLRGRNGLRKYLEQCFAEETQPAETWFDEPAVDGGRAYVEYWAVIHINGQPTTVYGCTVLTFNEAGLAKTARDYSHVREGYHERPGQAFGG
ncbi:nuclear transport factor 2 family protein [Arthrobacter sp. HLT1-20]